MAQKDFLVRGFYYHPKFGKFFHIEKTVKFSTKDEAIGAAERIRLDWNVELTRMGNKGIVFALGFIPHISALSLYSKKDMRMLNHVSGPKFEVVE